MKKPSEAELVKACLMFLQAKGCLVWRCNTGGAYYPKKGGTRFVRFSLPGTPDIVGWGPDGHGIAVECKRPGNTLTVDQAAFLARAVRIYVHAGYVFCVGDLVEFWEMWYPVKKEG